MEKNNVVNSEQQEFNLIVKEQKQKRYEHAVKIASFAISFFSVIMLGALIISFLFLDMFKVFSINFNFIGIVAFLDGLPNSTIFAPEGQLIEVIFACVYLIIYLILTISLIINTVKIVKLIIKLFDLSVNELDPKDIANEITSKVVNCYLKVFGVVFMALPTSKENLPLLTIIMAMLFVVLVIAETVLKCLHFYYGTKTLSQKGVALAIARRCMLIAWTALLVLLVPKHSLASWLSLSFRNYVVNFINISSTFIRPILLFYLFVRSYRLMLNTIRYGGYQLAENSMTFYGQKLTADSCSQIHRKKIKRGARSVIFQAILLVLFELVLIMQGIKWDFSLVGLVATDMGMMAIRYVYIIFGVLSIRCANRIPIIFNEKV